MAASAFYALRLVLVFLHVLVIHPDLVSNPVGVQILALYQLIHGTF